MIGSRAVGLLRSVSRSPVSQKLLKNVQQVRHSSNQDWCYRTAPIQPKWVHRGATIYAVMLWWWVYWNLYHGYPHVIGLYDGAFLQDPRTYTDEELGIPPDDA